MYKAASARLLLRSLSSASSAPGKSRLAASASARAALPRPCAAWVGRAGLARAAGTAPRLAAARAQIGPAVPAVERFQRRMATQGACLRPVRAWGSAVSLRGVVWSRARARSG